MSFSGASFLLISACIIAASQQQPVKVTLFYETLCPDCKEFILEQVYPAYEKLERYLTMDLVPYGFARATFVNGKWEFDCQHGPVECYRNKLDACAIDLSTEQSRLMKFVYCVEAQNQDASQVALEDCAKSASLDWEALQTCASGSKGSQLLLKYQKRMKETKPQVKYVPTVFFNDYFNSTMEKSAESNFLKTVCLLLEAPPAICSDFVSEKPQSHETFML